MAEGWDTALDEQLSLMHSFNTVEGREYLNGFAISLGRAGRVDANTGQALDPDPEYAEELVGMATKGLPECDPFYVSDELTELIGYAAESFKPEAIELTDMIVPAGFAYFGKPLYIIDTRGLKMPFRAMQWNVLTNLPGGSRVHVPEDAFHGIVVTLYSHRADGDPDDAAHGNYTDQRIGGSDLAMEYVTSLRFGVGVADTIDDESIRDMHAHIKVFFRLCQQTIAVPHRQRVARPTWKRARKSWKDIKEVVVFTLRRAKNATGYEGEERDVEWSHRWLVQGHWRNQPYKDGDGTIYKQIWIAPYVKGPDDKPLILKRRAFELVR